MTTEPLSTHSRRGGPPLLAPALAWVVLTAASVVLHPGTRPDADPAATLALLRDHAGAAQLSATVLLASAVPLAVWVAAAHRRTGLATAAVRTVTAWALADLGLEQLWARTDPANVAAIALFGRLGWDRLGAASGAVRREADLAKPFDDTGLSRARSVRSSLDLSRSFDLQFVSPFLGTRPVPSADFEEDAPFEG